MTRTQRRGHGASAAVASRGHPFARGALVLAAIVGVIALEGALEDPIHLVGEPAASSPPVTAQDPQQVPISTAALWCPGPEQQGLTGATVSESDQQVVVQAIAPPRDGLGPDFVEPSSGQLTLTAGDEPASRTDERVKAVEESVATADAAQALGSGALAAGLTASQVWLGDQEQDTGLALTACRPPQDSAWLLAGGRQAGRAERLVLINPGRAPISVDVDVWGSANVTSDDDEEGGSQIALEPGERKIVLLDALAPAVATPAVQVSATGGPVTAYLADRWLEGTTDRGRELIGPTGDPATSHVMTGIADSASMQQSQPATLRVAVPGAEPAVVQLRALTDEGAVDLPTDVSLLNGEESADIELAEFPTGTKALVVDSDVPTVVSLQLMSTDSDEGRTDIAWVPSTSPIAGLAGTALPQTKDEEAAIAYSLDIASPLGAQVTVHRAGSDGEVAATRLEVSAGTAAQLDLSLAEAVWVQVADGQAFATVSAQSIASVSDEDPTAASRRPAQSGDEQSASVDEVTLISVLPLTELPRYRSLIDVVPQYP